MTYEELHKKIEEMEELHKCENLEEWKRLKAEIEETKKKYPNLMPTSALMDNLLSHASCVMRDIIRRANYQKLGNYILKT